ncbi:type I restriction enzyme HsdR N-terminal domain-containing protein [Aureitalea marina]|uniref:Restriction endonuclease subunit R n=1 Tax=Aureitalea marina TaxID=930804 RepID=A0A2S7KN67_9FLAO|nr:type I restriction enzyme HsdR N-terminal domain-containing protein [Aureitalea marina]PQB04074.1 restriction endonuclease subunit R [Aureitalea marina]
MEKLNFPEFQFRFKNRENKSLIFDRIRKKFVILTPEEWVRQHYLSYLMEIKHYPPTLINVEKKISVHGQPKRYDIVVFYPNGRVRILVECKAPQVRIDQETFDQIARYHLSLQADFLLIGNGLSHYCCQVDQDNASYHFLKEIPAYTISN